VPARQLEALVHFASRGAMDIRGLSYARIQQLIAAGLVHDAADVYDLRTEQLTELERFADKSAENLVEAIAESKAQPLSRLIFALGIDYVGEIAARLLAGTSARWTGWRRRPRRRSAPCAGSAR
jgi:DNA ligase (NAD+)